MQFKYKQQFCTFIVACVSLYHTYKTHTIFIRIQKHTQPVKHIENKKNLTKLFHVFAISTLAFWQFSCLCVVAYTRNACFKWRNDVILFRHHILVLCSHCLLMNNLHTLFAHSFVNFTTIAIFNLPFIEFYTCIFGIIEHFWDEHSGKLAKFDWFLFCVYLFHLLLKW